MSERLEAYSLYAYMLLAVLHGAVNQLGVFGLLGSSKDERWVGSGILWLVFLNSYNSSAMVYHD